MTRTPRTSASLAALLAVCTAAFGPGISALDAQTPGNAPASSASSAAALRALEARIAAVVDADPVRQAHWGILAVDLETGDTLVSRSAFRKFIPASNMKVLVTSAALWTFGPDHRFRTEVFAVGERDGEVLRGDLIVRPSGDPTWSSRWYRDDPDAPLRDLARQVAATGIRTVSGELVVAASRWDSTAVQGSWMTFNVPWGFSAVPAPFAIEESTTTIEVRAAEIPGVPASIDWSPRSIPSFVQGEVWTVAASDSTAEVEATWLPESGIHRVSGTIRAGRVDSLEVSTRVPVREARTRFIDILGAEGVALLQLPTPATPGPVAPTGAPVDSMTMGEDPERTRLTAPRPRTPVVWAGADSLPRECDPFQVAWCDLGDPVAVHESPPLLEIARNALEPSQNWITEQLLRALALETRGRASWEDGAEALRSVLAERAGIDTLDVALQDGSGLSAYNLITPRAVVSILTEMDAGPMAAGWRDALAAPGERDSTLQYRLQGLEGRVQAKTGTISNVNSLSGYLFTDDGRRLAFSILTNGSGLDSSVMRAAIDRVVRELAAPLN